MNPNSFFVGDVVRLSGKTRHGKNRVRENGEFWEIITVDGGESSILSTKICVVPLNDERRDNWRWLDVPEDEHMEIEHVLEYKNQKYKDRLLRVKNPTDIQKKYYSVWKGI